MNCIIFPVASSIVLLKHSIYLLFLYQFSTLLCLEENKICARFRASLLNLHGFAHSHSQLAATAGASRVGMGKKGCAKRRWRALVRKSRPGREVAKLQ